MFAFKLILKHTTKILATPISHFSWADSFLKINLPLLYVLITQRNIFVKIIKICINNVQTFFLMDKSYVLHI